VEPDIEEHGVKFFMRIFEIAPPALQLFSFKDEVQLEQSPAMRAHASVVMRTVGQAVAGLSDLQTLVPVLQKLGAGHAEYNVQPEHFAIVGSSLLWTLEIGLSGAGAWTPEVKDAWSKTYATVQSVMEPALTAEIQKRNAMKLATAQAAQTLKTGIVVAGVMASKAKEVGGSSKTEGLPKEGESSSSSRQSAAETSPNDPIAVVEAKVGLAGVGQALHPEAEEKLAQEAQQHPSHRRKSSGGGSSSEHLVDMSYRNNACNGREEGDTVSQMSSERSHGGGLGDDDDDYDDDDDEVSSSDEGGGDYETSSDDDSSEDEEAGSEGRAGRKSGMRTPKGRGGCSSPSGESPVTELTKRSPRPAASAEHQMVPPICPPALSLGSGGPAHRTNNAGGGSPKVTPPLKSDMELLEGMLCEDASAARARISKSRGGVRDPSLSLVSSIAPKGEWGTDSGIKIKTVRSSNKDREWDCFVEDDDCVTDDRSLGKIRNRPLFLPTLATLEHYAQNHFPTSLKPRRSHQSSQVSEP
jgi:hemoglobin-like flavoprotein